jgi:hypothetical protein
MSEVEAWCVKSPDGFLEPWTVEVDAGVSCIMFAKHARGESNPRDLWHVWQSRGYKVVKVKISEVESE